MRLYYFLLIVEDFDNKYEEEFLHSRIFPIEDLHEVAMVMKIYL